MREKVIKILTSLLAELNIAKSDWGWISEVISSKYKIVGNTSTLTQYQKMFENKNEE